MSTQTPLVSVVVPTYGRLDELERALKSLQKQSYSPIEVVVVDDNAEKIAVREQVKALVASISGPNSFSVKLVLNEKNMGGAASRNQGIKASSGEYIAFLDDDDEYMPEKIALQLELLRRKDTLALVYCYTVSKNEAGRVLREYRYDYTGKCVYNAMLDCIAATSQWLCRRSALLAVNMFSNVPCKQDSTLLLKLLLAGYEIDRVPQVLTIYYEHENGRISNNSRNIKGEQIFLELCREHYDALSSTQKRNVEYNAVYRMARLYACSKNTSGALYCLVQMIKLKPFKPGNIKAFAAIGYKRLWHG